MNYLVVIDMQRDFVTGALGTPEARAILPGVVERIRAAKAAGDAVLYTLDTHGEDYLDTAEGRKLPVPHCIRGTDGWLPERGVGEALGLSQRFEKPTFGCLQLARYMQGEARRWNAPASRTMSVELIGVCTDICVISNALLIKAAVPEANIRVNAGLCAGTTPENHAAALTAMRCCQIDVI